MSYMLYIRLNFNIRKGEFNAPKAHKPYTKVRFY